jgi:hypothetical protein
MSALAAAAMTPSIILEITEVRASPSDLLQLFRKKITDPLRARFAGEVHRPVEGS